MKSSLFARDFERLAGVHPDLVRVVERARLAEPFIVVEGLRTRERQAALVKAGASRTMNSRHLTGHAVDLAYWLDDGDGVPEQGEVRFDWPLASKLAAAMKAAAATEGVALVWGGDWASFPDGPHFELDRRSYP
ncbi:MAG: M15 family peptidase [Caulobacteraceae bacterium]|nr:M15 family peptidase [Caulobacteraceae bacterium]